MRVDVAGDALGKGAVVHAAALGDAARGLLRGAAQGAQGAAAPAWEDTPPLGGGELKQITEAANRAQDGRPHGGPGHGGADTPAHGAQGEGIPGGKPPVPNEVWKTARLREANAYAAAHGLKGFAANQPKWSLARCLLETDDTLVQMDGEMARWHRETGAVCTPYTSQAKGYFMKLQAGTLSEKARERYDAPENRAIYEKLLALSQQTGHSIGALQLAYLTSQPFPTLPIVGVSSLEQVRALEEAGNVALTQAQIDGLRTME